jgi:predicted naringenin-chalcone synthase
MRGIVIYCFIVFSLLLKDGVSLAINTLREQEKTTISYDVSVEDSIEEDGFEDLFSATLPDVITPVLANHWVQELLDQYQVSPLQVLLEQVSPPPRMA